MEASTLDVFTDQKQNQLEVNRQKFDRISNLHDSILHHIFSFLPIKYVVQCSVLSKRWHKLWVSFPYLNFEESPETDKERFVTFVDKFLLYHDNNLTIIKFRLACDDARNRTSHIKDWISAVSRARVQELHLTIQKILIGGLPSSLIRCNSLGILKLDFGSQMVRFPKSFAFPNLKSMHLFNIIVKQNFSDQLLNSPKLKILFLKRFFVEYSSTSLPDDHDETLSNLERVYIGLVLKKDPINYKECSPRQRSLFVSKFIKKLANVKNLGLSYTCIKFLQRKGNLILDHLPTFRNLIDLELGLENKKGDVGVMACLLSCSPVARSLKIRFINSKRIVLKHQRKDFPSLCMPRSLKRISVQGISGKKYQVELLKFILRIKSLRRVDLRVKNDKYVSISLCKQVEGVDYKKFILESLREVKLRVDKDKYDAISLRKQILSFNYSIIKRWKLSELDKL